MKCFLLLTLLFPVAGEDTQKPVNIDQVTTIANVREFNGRAVKGSILSIAGRGFVYVRETYQEIFAKSCIAGTGGSRSTD